MSSSPAQGRDFARGGSPVRGLTNWPLAAQVSSPACDTFHSPHDARGIHQQLVARWWRLQHDIASRSSISAIAVDLAELKKRTLTNLYNQRPVWLADAHAALDAAVAAAYGWMDYADTMPDNEIVARLLALNGERAAQI